MLLQRILKLNENFAVQSKSAKNIGCQLENENEQNILGNPKRFFVHLTCSTVALLAMSFHIVANFGELELIVEPLWITVGASSACIGIFFFLLKVRQVRRLKAAFEKLLKFQAHKTQLECLLESAAAAEHPIWLEQHTKSQMLLSFYWAITWIAEIVFFVRPILPFFFNNSKQGSSLLKPPVGSIFPYDNHKPFNWALTNCIFWFGVAFWRDALFIVDGTFCWFLFSTTAHFKILRQKISEFCHEISENRTENSIKREAKHIFAYHQELVILIGEIDEIFSPIIFAQIFLCAVQFAFALNSLNTPIDLLTKIFLLTAIGVFGIRLAFYCFGGEQIQNECEMTCDAFYLEMPLELITQRSMKRSFLIFLARLQRPKKLTAGHFFVANRVLFVRVLNTAWSYAAFVQAKM